MDIDHTYLNRIYKEQENALYLMTRCCRCGNQRPVITVDDNKGWSIVNWYGPASVPTNWVDGTIRVFTQQYILNFDTPMEHIFFSIGWLCPICNQPGVIVEIGHEVNE